MIIYYPSQYFVFKSLINKIYKSDFASEAADSKLRRLNLTWRGNSSGSNKNIYVYYTPI